MYMSQFIVCKCVQVHLCIVRYKYRALNYLCTYISMFPA
jgi:hypothetical protein